MSESTTTPTVDPHEQIICDIMRAGDALAAEYQKKFGAKCELYRADQIAGFEAGAQALVALARFRGLVGEFFRKA